MRPSAHWLEAPQPDPDGAWFYTFPDPWTVRGENMLTGQIIEQDLSR